MKMKELYLVIADLLFKGFNKPKLLEKGIRQEKIGYGSAIEELMVQGQEIEEHMSEVQIFEVQPPLSLSFEFDHVFQQRQEAAKHQP
jgi:hypothetical protein